MPTTASRLGQISLVIVPTRDQARSIDFDVEKLGFEKRTDIPFGGRYRWVEVYPPAGSTGLALAPPPPGGQLGVMTGVIFTTDDIEATHAELREQRIDVDGEISRMGAPVPPMFFFRDPDGNSLLAVERG
jgi:catechol 2,3-dioxygenase-like lactoylglutathione lyase family enzyme